MNAFCTLRVTAAHRIQVYKLRHQEKKHDRPQVESREGRGDRVADTAESVWGPGAPAAPDAADLVEIGYEVSEQTDTILSPH